VIAPAPAEARARRSFAALFELRQTYVSAEAGGCWYATVLLACPYISKTSDLHKVEIMDNLRISTARSELDLPLIHQFLAEQSGWAKGISRPLLERAIDNSLCFGGFLGASQVAFARVISDYATFANLVDVFVLPEQRGNGYAKAIMSAISLHPQLQGLRRFTLATADAHSLYAQFGFTAPLKPQSLMEKYFPGIYQNTPEQPDPH